MISSLPIIPGEGLSVHGEEAPVLHFLPASDSSLTVGRRINENPPPTATADDSASQTMRGAKPSIVLGTNFSIQLSVKKSTTIVFLRCLMLLLPHKTHSMMGKPRRQRVIMQQWAFTSSRGTPGKIITSRDALQNPQMAPPALSPELKTDLTNTISLKDIKSGENRKNGGEDEDIASWTKRLGGSEQREGGFLSETTSQPTSSRQGKLRNS